MGRRKSPREAFDDFDSMLERKGHKIFFFSHFTRQAQPIFCRFYEDDSRGHHYQYDKEHTCFNPTCHLLGPPLVLHSRTGTANYKEWLVLLAKRKKKTLVVICLVLISRAEIKCVDLRLRIADVAISRVSKSS